jgi:hypothetical protein
VPPAKAKKPKAEPGPDQLVRQSAGAYRSGDGRFTVSQSDSSWFVVDTEQLNELGQELIHGPFASLKEATAAIPGARNVTPLLRKPARRPRPARAAPAARPRPQSWIDRLDEAQQRSVRRLISALEKEGVSDAEDLVRQHREDGAPFIATRLIEHRLRELVDSRPADQRELARDVAVGVIEVLTSGGSVSPSALPRWALVQIEPDIDATPRVIRPRL